MEMHFRVKQEPGIVFDCLSDHRLFVQVHPVIYRMDAEKDGTFTIYEKLKFGFIPWKFRYKAQILKDKDKRTITITAQVMRLVKIEVKLKLSTDGDHTIIHEEAIFKSLLPVTWLIERIFRDQHAALFRNIGAFRPQHAA